MRSLLILALAIGLAQGGGLRVKVLPQGNDGSLGRYKEDLTQEERDRQAANCEGLLDEALIEEIRSYQDIAQDIIKNVIEGSWKGRAYNDMVDLIDKHPGRLTGFQNLEDSIDYMLERMKTVYDLQHVRGEQVLIPHWVRGEETATLLSPHVKNLHILGLGTSVGTPEEGIEADVIVVSSYADLDAKKDQVPGKIVVYNQGWLGSYGATNIYRTGGASAASRYGAVASLIQSVGPFSLDTPHTGGQSYADDISPIPTACITMEDADYMWRLQEQGNNIRIHLKMLDYNLPMTTSRNGIGEIPGRTLREEYVAVSGHIDCWDVGQGAMDDAGGVMIGVVALGMLKEMINEGLLPQPKRTMQVIMWTGEEQGLWGVQDFARQHADILANYSAVFESDSGTFDAVGLDFAGNDTAGCIVREVLQLLEPINATQYQQFPTVSSDITVLIEQGVPGISLNNANDMYFWYHHTEGDTATMQNADEMDRDTALWAVSSYVLADISVKLPRDVTRKT